MIIHEIKYFDTIIAAFEESIENNYKLFDFDSEQLIKNIEKERPEILRDLSGKTSVAKMCACAEYLKEEIRNIAIGVWKENSNDDNVRLEHECRNGKTFCSSIFADIGKHFTVKSLLEKNEKGARMAQVAISMHFFLGNIHYYEINAEKMIEILKNGILVYLVREKSGNNIEFNKDVIRKISSLQTMLKFNLDVKYDIVQGDIQFSEDDYKKIHKVIENLIESIGGITFLNLLFEDKLKDSYDKKIDRYLIGRNKNTVLEKKIIKRIPYNYLIQIAMKHLGENKKCDNKKEIYSEIIKLGESYLDVLDLQSYSIWEDINFSLEYLPFYLVKNMVFEKMVVLEQYSQNIIVLILKNLYKPLVDRSGIFEYKFCEYMKVVKFILRLKSNKVVSFEEIKKATRLRENILKEILKDISVDRNEINAQFNYILDSTNIRNWPLVRMKCDRYFLLDSRICGYAFCEVLYGKMKVNSYNPDKEQGVLLEKMLYRLLAYKKIDFMCGKYEQGTLEEGECDLILENNKNIIFVEIKKRPLAASFENADDIALLNTLGWGMLYAQRQLLKHKRYLEKYTKMRLVDQNGCKYELQLGDRNIVLISMCLPEYFFLTNKNITEQILCSLLVADYKTLDEKRDRELEKFRSEQNKIIDLMQLKTDEKINLREIFFDSLFRSLQQIYATLEISKNKDEFIDNLTNSIHVVEGSLDYYSQMIKFNNLKKHN